MTEPQRIEKIKSVIRNMNKDADRIINEMLIPFIHDAPFINTLIEKLNEAKNEETDLSITGRYKQILIWLRDEKILVHPDKEGAKTMRDTLMTLWNQKNCHPIFTVKKEKEQEKEIKIVSINDYMKTESEINTENAVSMIVQCMFVVFHKNENNENEMFYTLHDRSYSGADDAASKYALVSGRLSLTDLENKKSLEVEKLYKNALIRELQEIDELNLTEKSAEKYVGRAVYVGSFTNKEKNVLSCLFGIGITPEEYNDLNKRGPYLIPIKSEEYSKLRLLDLVGDILYHNSCNRCNSYYKEKKGPAVDPCIIKKIDENSGKMLERFEKKDSPGSKKDRNGSYINTPFYKNRIRFKSNSTIISVDISNYSLLEKNAMLEIRDQLQRFLFSFFPIPKPGGTAGYSSYIQTTGDGYNIVLSSDEPGNRSKFKLTEESFTKMEKESIPTKIRDKLLPLKDREYPGKEKFINAIEDKLAAGELDQYKLKILKYSRPFMKTFYLALISYFFAIYLKFEVQNLKEWSKNLKDTYFKPYQKLDIRIGLHADDMDKIVSLDQTYFPGDGIINATRILDFAREGQILCSQNFAAQLLTEIEEFYSENYKKNYDAVQIEKEQEEEPENRIWIKFIKFFEKSEDEEPKDSIELWDKFKFLELLKKLELPPDITRIISKDISKNSVLNNPTISDFGFLTDKHSIRHRVFHLDILFEQEKSEKLRESLETPLQKIPIILRNKKTTANEMNKLIESFQYAKHLTIYGYSNIRLMREIYKKLKKDENYFKSLTDCMIIFYSFDQIRHVNEPWSMSFARLWWIMGFLYANKIVHLLKKTFKGKINAKVKINEVRYGFNVLKVIYSNEVKEEDEHKDHIRFTIPLPGSKFEHSPVFIISRGDPVFHYYFDICEKYIEQGKKENSDFISVEEYECQEENVILEAFFKADTDPAYQAIIKKINKILETKNDKKKKSGEVQKILMKEVPLPKDDDDRTFITDVATEIVNNPSDSLYVAQLFFCLKRLIEFKEDISRNNNEKLPPKLEERKLDYLELGNAYDQFIKEFKRS